LDVTWVQPDAQKAWADANSWAAGLTLGGVSGWRLPYFGVTAGAGPFMGPPVNCATDTELACRDNEPVYRFYDSLGGTFSQPILTSSDPDLALFPTLQSGVFRSGTDFDSAFAWSYTFGFGN
jgi:hypothetical protein